MNPNQNIRVFYVMGVSGCGKSTVGKLLAQNLDIPFFDGDDYHPQTNVVKMKSGKALNDQDRHGWLIRLNQLATEHRAKGVVIACSALKKDYRKLLHKGIETTTKFVFLSGTFEEIMDRMQQRKDHFMPPTLLQSQFDTLEVPKEAITISIQNTPEAIVSSVLNRINK